MITCNTCGTRISEMATRCPKCGADPRGPKDRSWGAQSYQTASAKPVQPQQPKAPERSAHQTVLEIIALVFGLFAILGCMFSIPIVSVVISIVCGIIAIKNSKHKSVLSIAGISLSVIAILIGSVTGIKRLAENSESDNISKTSATATPKPDKTQHPSPSPSPSSTKRDVKIIDEDYDTTGYYEIDAEILYEYGLYMDGEHVVTVIRAESVSYDSINASTLNGKRYMYSISCYFDSETVDQQIKEDDIITVAGTIEGDPRAKFFTTVNLKNCVVISTTDSIAKYSGNINEQIAYASSRKKQYDDMVAEIARTERNNYIARCESVSYSELERNPDKYEGKLLKVSGTVTDVSEGIAEYVTYEVNSGGNMWKMTYWHKDGESRILVGDYLTFYGEYEGVPSYSNLLGFTDVPTLKLEYYG